MSEDSIFMLNNIYCVPDEKDFGKHVYIGFFFLYISFGDEKRKTKFTAIVALIFSVLS